VLRTLTVSRNQCTECNIFTCFCGSLTNRRDFAGIYGGDGGAAKAAKHEIKSQLFAESLALSVAAHNKSCVIGVAGLKALISCHIDQLFFPLMCVVDYLGLRLVCTSFIEGIGGSGSGGSLCYGSQDAGRTVHCSNPVMNEKVRQACNTLNLKSHVVIASDGVGQLLYGPADLEGHAIPLSAAASAPASASAGGMRKAAADKYQYYLLDFAVCCAVGRNR
jgi:hypothetical protein